MEISSLEDYSSFFFPDMDPKRRGNDTAFNDLLNSLIHLDNKQTLMDPTQFQFDSSPPTKRPRRAIEDIHNVTVQQQQQQQRRLWVKDRSKDWWERCTPDVYTQHTSSQ